MEFYIILLLFHIWSWQLCVNNFWKVTHLVQEVKLEPWIWLSGPLLHLKPKTYMMIIHGDIIISFSIWRKNCQKTANISLIVSQSHRALKDHFNYLWINLGLRNISINSVLTVRPVFIIIAVVLQFSIKLLSKMIPKWIELENWIFSC